jgi:phospholipid/cholesterol/gamma-HCH transport system ATP-binding protein
MKFGLRHEIREIKLEDVSLREASGLTWFEDVNLTLEPGHSIWLKGEVVASHLLKVISGLIVPTTGRVLINGQDIHEMDFEEFLPYRLNLGYTFNLGGILNNRTIKENLMLPFLYHGAPAEFAEQEVAQVLEIFDLKRYQDFRPAGVPGVVRKLCCIGRALVVTPQVLLMDDPTSSMKKHSIECLRAWIEERRREFPMMVVMASEHHELFHKLEHETYSFESGQLKAAEVLKAVG